MVRPGIPQSNGAKMDYWNEIITQKSWEVLQRMKKEIDFTLIGGWAAYLWARSHKSKDIDIVVDYKELGKLKLNYNLNKNDSLKKYEIKIEDVDIDVYIPFYSKLPIIKDINKYTVKLESFKVVRPEALLVLKQAAEISRSDTEKGLKDRIDIIDLLLKCDLNLNLYKKTVEKEKLQGLRKRLIEIIIKFSELKYIELNPREFKLKKYELIEKLKR